VDTVVFDKTGTLTEGRPTLTDLAAVGGDQTDALRLAAALEAGSEHPLAAAIVAAAQQQALELPAVDDFQAIPGYGVSGQIDGRRILLGAERLLAREHIESGDLGERAGALSAQGKTPVFLAVDAEVRAVLAVADPLKAESAAVIAALRSQGLQVAMITGDSARTATAIARQAGIDQVEAEVLPSGKAEVVQRLQSEGRKVAFVGDGINDAPALAQADVGIAVGSGTDIAIEAADVTLTRGELDGVATSLNVARRTLSTIRGNLFWAFFYNVLLIPLAAGVLYPGWGVHLNPMFAGVAMGFSSVFVVTNSLRLRRLQPAVMPPAPAGPGARQSAPAAVSAAH